MVQKRFSALLAFLFTLTVVYALFLIQYLNLGLEVDLTFRMVNKVLMLSHNDKNSNFKPENFLHHYNSNTCVPQENIFYLNTDKTNSLMAAILYRYAIRKSLKLVPAETDRFSDEMIEIRNTAVERTAAEQIEPLYKSLDDNRMAFNTSNDRSVQYILPKDTINIISLTHPMAQLQLYFKEVNVSNKLKINHSDQVQYFLEHYDRNAVHYTFSEESRSMKSMASQQLGVSFENLDDMQEIDQLIQFVENKFDIVMRKETFDMSLLYLRRRLCWSVEDILYVPLHSPKLKTMGDKTLRAHEEWSAADYKLYNHFSDKDTHIFPPAPEDYWNEYDNFKILKTAIGDFCNETMKKILTDPSAIFKMAGNLETGKGRSKISVDARPWGDPFILDAVSCTLMNTKTGVLRNVARMHKLRFICNSYFKKISHPLQESIHQEGDNILIHNAYCSNFSKFYNVPVGVLAMTEAYK